MLQANDLSAQAAANPLLNGIVTVEKRVSEFQDEARQFYYAVLLSVCPCPMCGGQLSMTGPSQCLCECGNTVDPTIAFQLSSCCGAPLQRRTLHYVCSSCGRIVPSRFLFDERLFDSEYFLEKMRESRERKREAREEMLRTLLLSRSDALCLTETPDLESIPGLEMDLDAFIGSMPELSATGFVGKDAYRMETYRSAILEAVPPGCVIRFGAIPPIALDGRLDRARRFITLIFMQQAGEVDLTQCGENDILVERYETDSQG